MKAHRAYIGQVMWSIHGSGTRNLEAKARRVVEFAWDRDYEALALNDAVLSIPLKLQTRVM